MMTNTQGITATSKQRLRQPNLQPTQSKKKNLLPNAPQYACYSYTPGSAHVAAGLSESADPGWPGREAWGSESWKGFKSSGISKRRGGLEL